MSRAVAVQWAQWAVATIVAAVTMTSFAYTNFETKDDSRRSEQTVEKRLDRIENKVDQLLSR